MPKIGNRAALSALALLSACDGAMPRSGGDADACTTPAAIATLPDALAEASGIAASRAHHGVFWVLNDTEPVARIFAIDSTAAVRSSVRVPGAMNVDWEDIEVARCDAGYCVYIAEIGDNAHRRDDVGFYRIPEPAPDDTVAAAAEWFPIEYPTGPQDAEALFVLPGERVFVISKGRNRPVTLYRYPPPLRRAERVMLELVEEWSEGVVQLPDMVTGAAATIDGSVVAVRTYTSLQLYHVAGERLVPVLDEPGIDLSHLAEPQGEGVAIREDGTILLSGERGPQRQPAPLSRLRCELDR